MIVSYQSSDFILGGYNSKSSIFYSFCSYKGQIFSEKAENFCRKLTVCVLANTSRSQPAPISVSAKNILLITASDALWIFLVLF